MKRQNPTEQADNLQNKGFGPCKVRGLPAIYRVLYQARGWGETLLLEANTVHCGGSESLGKPKAAIEFFQSPGPLRVLVREFLENPNLLKYPKDPAVLKTLRDSSRGGKP